MAEDRFRAWYYAVREPIAGYNCFGQVFASRRTAIYEAADIEVILAEDGYAEIADAKDLRLGDVVIYVDKDGINHAARIVKIETGPLVVSGYSEPAVSPSYVVLSKFDDVSGEYEHNMQDFRWDGSELAMRFYRDRSQLPKHPPKWKTRIARLEP